MGPDALAQVLQPLDKVIGSNTYSKLIAGINEGDDAAVYKLDNERCLVFTLDFFTPVVDKPYDFGAIAAANSMSDVYATGAEPVLALNIAAFPSKLDNQIISDILRGGAEKAAEGGCIIAGGHTVIDNEPKYGLAVIGFAHPDEVLLKSGAKVGDALVLCKALGTGLVTTAAKIASCPEDSMASAVKSMKMLNGTALKILKANKARACTDVTGFSLPGHAMEIAQKSRVSIDLFKAELKYLPYCDDLVREGYLPAGAYKNRTFYSNKIKFDAGIDNFFIDLFFCPETSGGLLASVPMEHAKNCLKELEKHGYEASLVGIIAKKHANYDLRLLNSGLS